MYFGKYILPGAPVVVNLLQILMSARLPTMAVVRKGVLIIRVVIRVHVTLGISSTPTERRALS